MSRTKGPAHPGGALAWLDQAELAACRRFNGIVHSAGFLKMFQASSRLGDGLLWYTLIPVIALFFGPAGRHVALQCAVAGPVGFMVYSSLKNRLVRERPFITHRSIVCAGRPLDRFSFPSGHTLHAVNFSMLICAGLPQLTLLLVPVALCIAVSRVVLGLHYPSDVAAGGMIGAAIALITMNVIGA